MLTPHPPGAAAGLMALTNRSPPPFSRRTGHPRALFFLSLPDFDPAIHLTTGTACVPFVNS